MWPTESTCSVRDVQTVIPIRDVLSCHDTMCSRVAVPLMLGSWINCRTMDTIVMYMETVPLMYADMDWWHHFRRSEPTGGVQPSVYHGGSFCHQG